MKRESALDRVDTKKLWADIELLAREAPAALRDFRSASAAVNHDLCVLFGAGSYRIGRQRLFEFLLTNREESER